MALIVEDGSVVAGANSYVSLNEADNYFEYHPYYSANWADLDDDKKEAFLSYATSVVDQLFRWKGYPVSLAQNLGFPRTCLTDKYGNSIPEGSIPMNLKKGVMEMAVTSSMGNSFETSSSLGLEQVKIDVIELKFDKTEATPLIPAYALSLLKDYGTYSAGSRVIKAIVS